MSICLHNTRFKKHKIQEYFFLSFFFFFGGGCFSNTFIMPNLPSLVQIRILRFLMLKRWGPRILCHVVLCDLGPCFYVSFVLLNKYWVLWPNVEYCGQSLSWDFDFLMLDVWWSVHMFLPRIFHVGCVLCFGPSFYGGLGRTVSW